MKKLIIGIFGIVLSTGFGIGTGFVFNINNFETKKIEPKNNYYVENYKDKPISIEEYLTQKFFIKGI